MDRWELWSTTISKIIDECDLVPDFSTVELSWRCWRELRIHGKSLICGTTGFTQEQAEKFTEAGKDIPVMKAANTSYVVNVMREILGEAAARLGSKCKNRDHRDAQRNEERRSQRNGYRAG